VARWPELARIDRAREGAPTARRAALVAAGEALRERMLAGGRVASLRSYELVRFPYPSRYGLRDALARPWAYVALTNRVFVVRYRDLEGVARVLLVSPSDVARNAETPYFKSLARGLGPLGRAAEPLIAPRGPSVLDALARAGVTPDEVDYLTYDHLHTQDVRGWLGGDGASALLPRARLLVMRAEWESAGHLVAPQRAWYCPDGIAGIPASRVVTLDGSIALGDGVALVATPGHTEGNHSIVLSSRLGLTVTSENGVCPDAYAPAASAIPGLAAYAATGMDIVLNGNTLERGLDQYLSMVLERTIAGPSPRDPRFPNMLVSSELTPAWYAPGVAPGLAFGDVDA